MAVTPRLATRAGTGVASRASRCVCPTLPPQIGTEIEFELTNKLEAFSTAYIADPAVLGSIASRGAFADLKVGRLASAC